jgi:hypothetical protein
MKITRGKTRNGATFVSMSIASREDLEMVAEVHAVSKKWKKTAEVWKKGHAESERRRANVKRANQARRIHPHYVAKLKAIVTKERATNPSVTNRTIAHRYAATFGVSVPALQRRIERLE